MTQLDIRTGKAISIQIEFAKEHEKESYNQYQDRQWVLKKILCWKIKDILTGDNVEEELVDLLSELERG